MIEGCSWVSVLAVKAGFAGYRGFENDHRSQASSRWRRLWCHSAIKRFLTSAFPSSWGGLNLCLGAFFLLIRAGGIRCAGENSLFFVSALLSVISESDV